MNALHKNMSLGQRVVISGVMAAVVTFAPLGISTAVAQEETPDLQQMWGQIQELLTLIESLQAQVQALQTKQSVTESSSSDTELRLHAHVVVSDGPLRVRAEAAGTVTGRQSTGSTGKIMGGPKMADGYTWWYVDFANGATGYVAAPYLAVTTPPATEQKKPATDTDQKKETETDKKTENQEAKKTEEPKKDYDKDPVIKKDTEDTEDKKESEVEKDTKDDAETDQKDD